MTVDITKICSRERREKLYLYKYSQRNVLDAKDVYPDAVARF